MNITKLCAASVFALLLAQFATAQLVVSRTFTGSQGDEMPYELYVPPGVSDDDTFYPLVIKMDGLGYVMPQGLVDASHTAGTKAFVLDPVAYQ